MDAIMVVRFDLCIHSVFVSWLIYKPIFWLCFCICLIGTAYSIFPGSTWPVSSSIISPLRFEKLSLWVCTRHCLGIECKGRHLAQSRREGVLPHASVIVLCIGGLTAESDSRGLPPVGSQFEGGQPIVLLVLRIYLLGLNFQCIHRPNVSAHLRYQISVWRLCLEFWWRIPNQFCWIKHS